MYFPLFQIRRLCHRESSHPVSGTAITIPRDRSIPTSSFPVDIIPLQAFRDLVVYRTPGSQDSVHSHILFITDPCIMTFRTQRWVQDGTIPILVRCYCNRPGRDTFQVRTMASPRIQNSDTQITDSVLIMQDRMLSKVRMNVLQGHAITQVDL